jgi:pSer/pThr/pTyr-binding forkhead associated (FHA) protein
LGLGETAAVLIALDPEGNELTRFELPTGETVLGRDTGGIFGSDAFLSPRHAIFSTRDGKLYVNDLGSLNGVFRKLLSEQSERLASGQRFRIGQELLQFDELDSDDPDDLGVVTMGGNVDSVVGTISLVIGRETLRPSFPVHERGLNLGRERGDVLFPEDGYVSGLHCHLSYEEGDIFVTDLGSSNGTFVQLIEETELVTGDVLLMGQQLFRVAI